MPAAAGVWLANIAIGAASAGAVLASGMAIATVAYGVGYALGAVAVSLALSAVSTALMGRPRTGALRSRDTTVKTSTGPRSIIYGEVTVGGTLVYIGTTGAKNQYFDFVIAVAGHQVHSITDVWFDDVKIPNADINGGAAGGGAVGGTGQYKPRGGDTVAWVYKYLGTEGQTASSVLSSAAGDGYNPGKDSNGNDLYEWTADHRLQGIAYVHIRLRRNADAYDNGPPQSFRFRVKGALVYDPRKDSTNGGSGAHRLTDATTWEWSNNPALCAADYITGGTIVNDVATPVRRRGYGAPTSSVGWSYVIAAANICNEQVLIPPASPATYQNRYECDGVLTPSEDFPDMDCLEAILTSMLGQCTTANDTYRIYAGAYDTPLHSLDEDDLAGPLSNLTGAGRGDRYNTVRGTRFDQDTGLEVEFLPRTDTSYVSEDGRSLYHEIELPFTVNEYRAQRIAQIILRRSREQEIVTLQGQMTCRKVAMWETVSLSIAELGMSSKVFRCVGRKTRNGGEIPAELTLREELSTTYTDPLVSDYGSPVVTTVAEMQAGALDEPTNLTATSVAGGIAFTITPAASNGDGVTFEIYEHTASTPWSASSLVWEGAATTFILPKSDTTTRYYWVRARRNAAVSTTYPASTGISGAASTAGSGESGNSIAELSIYIRAASAPSTPTGGSYNFGTGVLTPPSSWSASVPAGTDPAYISRAVALVTGTTGIDSTLTWSSPVLVFQNGVDGEDGPEGPQGPPGTPGATGATGPSGAPAISSYLTNESVSLWAYADGTVVSYSPATGTFKVFSGATDVSSSFSLSTVSNPQSLAIGYASQTYSVTAGFDAGEDTASVTIRATGSGAYAGITLDKVFSLAKTRGGYEIVAALPTTNLFEGRVVYLTTLDGTNQPDKLYRYTGSAWTAAVPAVDISGTITETQIADNAISTGKLAANAVTAAKIAASTITATEIASNAVTADKINAGAVTSAKISVTSLSAITATIGTLRTASSGARVEIKDNLIEVYDASRLRVRIGVW